ncbi:MAG TPA: family 16 glycoside hydrolase [Gemmata sp.]|nr:family 16 glycoside hydrolase [Gemmata sp.]
MHRFFSAPIIALLAMPLSAQDRSKPAAGDDNGFRSLFNCKNLDGWVNVNCHPSTFYVKDGEIITTGKPTGFLRTDRQYENFVLEMDWMHVNKTEVGNSGLFVWGDPLPGVGTPYTRGIEVQVLINYPKVDWATNHGDIFSIHGAHCKPDRPHPKGYERCLPSEDRVKGGGEWNHYKVIANNGAIKLHVNGKEVSGVSQCNPRKGYLALESEGAECHFKNIRIKELPSTNPKPEECAKVAEGHKSLFNGIDLKGLKTEEGAWKAAGGVLRATGQADISTEKAYGACELIFDWKAPAKAEKPQVEVSVGGLGPLVVTLPAGAKAGGWNRQTVKYGRVRENAPITFKATNGLELMNIFVRDLQGNK